MSGQRSVACPQAKIAAVFLNGEYAAADEFYRAVAAAADVLMAADGGAARMLALGLFPSVVVGDFDSLTPEALGQLAARGARVVRHPSRKDQTDAELACEEALRLGAGAIDLVGGLGAAFDHAVGHLAILRRLAGQGVPARLLDPSLTCMVMPRWSRLLVAEVGARFSLQPLTAWAVVTLRGFEYELSAVRLRADSCRGLGNTVVEGQAEVRIHAGAAAVIVGASLQPMWELPTR